jgi:hypothetical protein
MVLTIPNADKSLVQMIEAINQKLSKPYKLVQEEDIPNAKTADAIKEAKAIIKKVRDGKKQPKNYKDANEFLIALNEEIA